jgi:hypothetical protein
MATPDRAPLTPFTPFPAPIHTIGRPGAATPPPPRTLSGRATLETGARTEVAETLARTLLKCFDHKQPELAETFFNSVITRVLHRTYALNDFIFVRAAVSDQRIRSPSGRNATSSNMLKRSAIRSERVR